MWGKKKSPRLHRPQARGCEINVTSQVIQLFTIAGRKASYTPAGIGEGVGV